MCEIQQPDPTKVEQIQYKGSFKTNTSIWRMDVVYGYATKYRHREFNIHTFIHNTLFYNSTLGDKRTFGCRWRTRRSGCYIYIK